MTYRISGLDPAPFRPLFGLPDEELAERGIVRMTVDERRPSLPGEPDDRAIGEQCSCSTMSAMTSANPYRAAHAIFVTRGRGAKRRTMSTRSRRCSRSGSCRCAASTPTG